jgi:hypothetical protein
MTVVPFIFHKVPNVRVFLNSPYWHNYLFVLYWFLYEQDVLLQTTRGECMQLAVKNSFSFVRLAILIITLFICASPAFAGFYTTVEVRQTYEDNVAGLVSDNPNTAIDDGTVTNQGPATEDNVNRGRGTPTIMRGEDNKGRGGGEKDLPPGDPELSTAETGTAGGGATQKDNDFSTELYADIGYLNKIDASTSLFVQASFQHTGYADFDQFDFTIFGISGGVKRRLSNIVSARGSLDLKLKEYDNPLRSGTSLGVKASLTERFGKVLWFREFYGFERNIADSAIYRYDGHSIGIRAGLDLTALWSIEMGYSYLLREYDEPAGYRVTSTTVSAGLTRMLGNLWSVIVGLDQETSKENFFSTTSTNNMVSVALQFLY